MNHGIQKKDGSGKKYYKGNKISLTENLNLYAQWSNEYKWHDVSGHPARSDDFSDFKYSSLTINPDIDQYNPNKAVLKYKNNNNEIIELIPTSQSSLGYFLKYYDESTTGYKAKYYYNTYIVEKFEDGTCIKKLLAYQKIGAEDRYTPTINTQKIYCKSIE